LREHTDFGWIIDLSPEGHWSPVRTRIFPGVPHPVCIGVFARGDGSRDKEPPAISYLAVSGNQKEKFLALRHISLKAPRWSACASPATASLRSAKVQSW